MEMISRLRRKFIALGTAAVILIVFVVLASLNLASFYDEGSRIEAVLSYIARHDGKLPDKRIVDAGFDYTPEFAFQTRYYWARIAADGVVEALDTSHIAAVSREDAAIRAAVLAEESNLRGSYEEDGAYYAYLVTRLDGGRVFVVVMDCTREMQIVWNGVRFSVLVGLFCILLYIAFVAFFSRCLTAPFVRNLKSQRQFVTNASHELKTPIAIISANTEVLEITMGKNQWTETILKQVKRLSGLVSDMVALAKLEERVADHFHPIEVNCSETAHEIAASFELPANEQGKKLVSEIADGVRVLADQQIIYTLMSVLVDNAVKYADDGGVVRIGLQSGRRGRGMVFSVTNPYAAGEGVDYSRFFERFYREDDTHYSEKVGNGNGLTIAAETVCYLKGRLNVHYREGAITFEVVLK